VRRHAPVRPDEDQIGERAADIDAAPRSQHHPQALDERLELALIKRHRIQDKYALMQACFVHVHRWRTRLQLTIDLKCTPPNREFQHWN
jgi:hypothetical protein